MARRCLILANPKAGALSRHEAFSHLRARLAGWFPHSEEAMPEFVVPPSLKLLSEAASQAEVLAAIELAPPPSELPLRLKRALTEGFDTVVAVGGDGTVRTFAQALLQHRLNTYLTLGILPLGTANNVAHSLQIPFDLAGAMRVLAEGDEQTIDVGSIGNEYFLEGAGVGLFADVLKAFGTEEPRPWQVGRMLAVLVPLFWNVRAQTLQLILDGVVEQDEAILVTVANGPYLGESFALAPTALLTDGLFDVVIVGALSRWELFTFARAALKGTHLRLPCVRRAQARTIAIQRVHRSHQLLPIHADDHIAAYTPATLIVIPHALRVLTPHTKPAEIG